MRGHISTVLFVVCRVGQPHVSLIPSVKRLSYPLTNPLNPSPRCHPFICFSPPMTTIRALYYFDSIKSNVVDWLSFPITAPSLPPPPPFPLSFHLSVAYCHNNCSDDATASPSKVAGVPLFWTDKAIIILLWRFWNKQTNERMNESINTISEDCPMRTLPKHFEFLHGDIIVDASQTSFGGVFFKPACLTEACSQSTATCTQRCFYKNRIGKLAMARKQEHQAPWPCQILFVFLSFTSA